MIPPRARAWRGEVGGPSELTLVLPKRFSTRYRASVRLRPASVEPPRVDILSLSATDLETGTRVRMRGDWVILIAGATATKEHVARVWADARVILGLARRQLGRPPGTTVTDPEIRRVIDEMKRAGRKRITLDTIAATSGTFTVDEIRYFLRVNGRRLSDYR